MAAKHHRLGLLLALGVAMSIPAPARAWTEFLSMDVLPENAGWTLHDDLRPTSSSVLSGGVLTLTAEWHRKYEAPASWINTVNAATGYTIEFRLRIATESDRPSGLGIWYNDNTYLTVINIDRDHMYMGYPIYGAFPAGVDATLWHTYRIVVLGSHHQIYLDGVLTLDFQHPGAGDGTNGLYFGDLGGSTYSQSQWDYVAYETHAVVPVAPTTWGRLKALYRGAPGAAHSQTRDR